MIANVSPGAASFEDTYNTLKYANRAKNIKTAPSKNVVNVQYHISNYTGIITGLKTEVSELKLQLQKKENINMKNENLHSINAETQSYFEKSIVELLTICEKEFTLKKTILTLEQEKLSCQSKITHIPIYKSNEIDLTNNENKIANEEKINSLNKEIETFCEKLGKYERRREKFSNHWYKNGLKDYNIEYLNSVTRNHLSKMMIVEANFKEKINQQRLSLREQYIKELETQVRLRDNLIDKNNIIIDETNDTEIIPLDKLKSDFTKLPYIEPKADDNFNINLNLINGNINLPQILSNNSCTIVTSEGNSKEVNSNSNYKELNYKELNSNSKDGANSKERNVNSKEGNTNMRIINFGNNFHRDFNKRDKSRSRIDYNQNQNKGEYGNINSNENGISKGANKTTHNLDKSPGGNNLLRRQQSPISRKTTNTPILYNNNNQYKKITAKFSNPKLHTDKNLRDVRDIREVMLAKVVKKGGKDNTSDLSYNISNESFEKEDSVDSKQKKPSLNNVRMNHFREKKTSNPNNISNSNDNHSQNHNNNPINPFQLNQNNNNFMNNNLKNLNQGSLENRVERDNFLNNKADNIGLKKKDLNVFLVDRQKFRNNSKKPFR